MTDCGLLTHLRLRTIADVSRAGTKFKGRRIAEGVHSALRITYEQ